jgi:hypothetical protein
MKWCCIGFKSGYEAAGQSGSAILIGRDSLGNPAFILQYRAVDKGEETQIQSDIPASIIIDVRIVFCSWCGVNLYKWYGKNIDSLYRNGLEIGALKQNS